MLTPLPAESPPGLLPQSPFPTRIHALQVALRGRARAPAWSIHWQRLFTGMYTWSMINYTMMELGAALGLGNYQVLFDLAMVWKFPSVLGWVLDSAPFLRKIVG